jgi:hypothetical protein
MLTGESSHSNIDFLMQLPDPDQRIQLEVGMEFNSFEEAEVWIKAYAKQQHFVVAKNRLTRDKERQPKKRTFVCERSGQYRMGKKQVDENIEPRHNTRSKKCDCQWHVNISRQGTVVRVTTILNEHNHELDVATDSFACANRRLTEDMKELIHYFTVYGHLDVGAQMELLKGKFPDRYAMFILICWQGLDNEF